VTNFYDIHDYMQARQSEPPDAEDIRFPPLDAYGGEFEGEQFREMTDSEKQNIKPFEFKPWVKKDLSLIPHPQFVYSDFYARGYTSVTLAPPKVGKSMLGLAEAIDMATGRGFLTGVEREPMNVVYYNAEDDQGVIDSRVAAILTHYGIDQGEIENRLFATSGVDLESFYLISGQDGVINEALFIAIEKFIEGNAADALIFDPLQDLSRSPETNEVFRLLGQRLRRMASMSKVALGLIHHTRKITPGATPTIDDGRGGSALRGTARFNRLLIGMTEDEGVKAGVENHRHFLRVADMESNLAPPSSDVNRWFQKISVAIPNGHYVGSIEPWAYPDAFDGITKQQAMDCQNAVASREIPARADPRAADWVGHTIGPILDLDVSDKGGKARLNIILKRWIKEDVLRQETHRDPRQGREVPVIVVGNNMISGA